MPGSKGRDTISGSLHVYVVPGPKGLNTLTETKNNLHCAEVIGRESCNDCRMRYVVPRATERDNIY